jgi:hypothetical protein
MRSLLWFKTLVFSVGSAECMTLTGYKGLPQDSVLNPFLYNLLGSGMNRFVPSSCDFLQYTDVLVTPRTSNCLCLGSNGMFVTQRFFFAAWTHDILCKAGSGIVLSDVILLNFQIFLFANIRGLRYKSTNILLFTLLIIIIVMILLYSFNDKKKVS